MPVLRQSRRARDQANPLSRPRRRGQSNASRWSSTGQLGYPTVDPELAPPDLSDNPQRGARACTEVALGLARANGQPRPERGVRLAIHYASGLRADVRSLGR